MVVYTRELHAFTQRLVKLLEYKYGEEYEMWTLQLELPPPSLSPTILRRAHSSHFNGLRLGGLHSHNETVSILFTSTRTQWGIRPAGRETR